MNDVDARKIAELLQYDPPREWRGGNLALIESRDPEVMLSGPSETGKTMAACYKAHMACREYPGTQGALVRKTAASVYGTVLLTMKRIIGNFPVSYFGGENTPERIIYPNGSQIWIGGMDNPTKVLSGERDFVQVCQGEELPLGDWEVITTRTTGRGAVMPYTQVFGDCNPAGANHYFLTRPRIRLLKSRHRDNPTLYDAQGNITEQGKRTLATLNALTGFRRKRLRDGLWITAEGVVYEDYDAQVHVIEPHQCPKFVRRFRAIDFGYKNPFVCQWWGMDYDGCLYLYREIYETKRLVEDLAKEIIKYTGDEKIEFTVADHDAEDRATLVRHGVDTIPAKKDVSPGIQAVQARMKVDEVTGKSRLYYVRGALVRKDPFLVEAKQPTCTEEETPEYVWAKTQDGRPNKEEPIKVGDHGQDAERYMVYYLDRFGGRIEDTSDLGHVEDYSNRWS